MKKSEIKNILKEFFVECLLFKGKDIIEKLIGVYVWLNVVIFLLSMFIAFKY